ncbi:MAG: hypothetical protein CL930_03750 [Deltaproteobacteria bacterium]|nr:hypothetical protein [Deltaproteobacteria bacterium]
MTMTRFQLPTVLSAAAICVAVTGCKDKTEDTGTEPTVTYEEVLNDVLIPSCGFNACHGEGEGFLTIAEGQTEAEWLTFESSAVPGTMLIEAGSASTSYLVKKIEGASDIEGDVMPPSGKMDQSRINKVRSWIDNIEE